MYTKRSNLFNWIKILTTRVYNKAQPVQLIHPNKMIAGSDFIELHKPK